MLAYLFDTHPSFQIDGNIGATAGIAEMLLQSHLDEINLLPALPKAWQNGMIHGLVARGGFEVSMDWQAGNLKQVKLLSKVGNACTLRYGSKTIQLRTIKGKEYMFDGNLQLQ